jgi:hypothetical protein
LGAAFWNGPAMARGRNGEDRSQWRSANWTISSFTGVALAAVAARKTREGLLAEPDGEEVEVRPRQVESGLRTQAPPRGGDTGGALALRRKSATPLERSSSPSKKRQHCCAPGTLDRRRRLLLFF